MAFCTKCGAQIQEGMTFCGSCGALVGASGGAPAGAPVSSGASPGAAASASGGLTSNVAAALAYVTIIPAIVFLVVEPFNKDKFVRFHSFQSIFFGIAWFVLWIGLTIVGWVLGHIPFIGMMFNLLLYLIVFLGGLVLWILLVVKAYQNQKWMLPVIGGLAAQQAG